MKHEELVKLGRKYANGDGVMIDTERAFGLWRLVVDELSEEDLCLYQEIRACHEEEIPTQLSPLTASLSHPIAGGFPMLSDMTAATPRSEAEVRNAFETIMEKADAPTLARLYDALRRVEEGDKKAVKERKPENIRFGNNLGFIMRQFGWNRAVFLEKMNTRLEQIPTYHKRQSSPSLSQIINGINGMDATAQMVLVELINNSDSDFRRKGRPVLRRSMTVTDLHLFPRELAAIFIKPKIDDERTRKLFAPLPNEI